MAAVRAGRSLTEVLGGADAPPPRLRPGVQALASHTLRRLGTVQALRQRLVPRPPPPAADALLLTALALLPPGCEQAEDAPRYEPHTVVDQAVRAAKRAAPAQSGLVNAVLRRALRESAELAAAVDADPVARWNHPAWWIARLQRDWPDRWPAVLAQNNGRAPMTLRVNARQHTPADYLARLQAAGIGARALGGAALVLDQPVPVDRLPGWADGAVSVQDAAAQLAAPLVLGDAAPAPGARLRVLDACAAPGGKTAHLLELADLEVVALDVVPQRLARVADNLRRLRLARLTGEQAPGGAEPTPTQPASDASVHSPSGPHPSSLTSTAELRAADAARPDTWWDGRPFDAILLDAPCSASGIVRRHPDVRWLRRDTDIAALAATQDALLDALWPLLAPGGRLVYCTCSVFRQEGAERVDAFLQRTSGARLLPSPGHIGPVTDNPPAGLTGPEPPSPPPVAGVFDGFFYAVLHKLPGSAPSTGQPSAGTAPR